MKRAADGTNKNDRKQEVHLTSKKYEQLTLSVESLKAVSKKEKETEDLRKAIELSREEERKKQEKEKTEQRLKNGGEGGSSEPINKDAEASKRK